MICFGAGLICKRTRLSDKSISRSLRDVIRSIAKQLNNIPALRPQNQSPLFQRLSLGDGHRSEQGEFGAYSVLVHDAKRVKQPEGCSTH